MKMLRRRLPWVSLVAGIGLFAGCQDPLSTGDGVAGAYDATTLRINESWGSFDALEAGADIFVVLHPDGRTTGHFFVPGGDEDGDDVSADLAGTWNHAGDRVTLDHPADTFLRDVVLEVNGRELVSDDLGIDLVLTRQ